MSVQEQGEHKSDEEHDGVHNRQCPGSLQHGAILVDVDGPAGPTLPAIVSKRSEIDVDRPGFEVGTISIVDATQIVDGGNQSSYEAEVDERNEKGRSPSRAQSH